jgi:DUF4097 and DUF4098 domain-containing protein YvlB
MNTDEISWQRAAIVAKRRLMVAHGIHGAIAVSLLLVSGTAAQAQRSITRRFETRGDVRLELKNVAGTVAVETWERNEIKISADMDTPLARIAPIQDGNNVIVNVMRENSGRANLGDVNFRIWLPVSSSVDIETHRGQIIVRGLQGSMLRARIWTAGDIELTGVRAGEVIAESGSGNIFFDGELAENGIYEFKSMGGDINIRLPSDASFRLTATAPFTRSIELGDFAGSGLQFIGDHRRVVGNVNQGGPMLTVINQRGRIAFLRR